MNIRQAKEEIKQAIGDRYCKCCICGAKVKIRVSAKGTIGFFCKNCRSVLWTNTNLAMEKLLNSEVKV